MVAGKSTMLTEPDAKRLLRACGIATPKGVVVSGTSAISNLKFPLVAKAVSPGLLHKTDAGGVVVGIKTRHDLETAVSALLKRFPGAKVLIEECITGGFECLAGIAENPTFGKVIAFGTGGVATELFGDVAFRVVPIGRADAEEMVGETRAGKALENFRGQRLDRSAAVRLLLQLSRLAEENHGILSLDLNPVLVRKKGAVVLDAKGITTRGR